jgi:hypothetical protein
MRPQNKVAQESVKKSYDAPRLTVHGTVEKITKAKMPGARDGMKSQI